MITTENQIEEGSLEHLQAERERLSSEITNFQQHLDDAGQWDSNDREEGWQKVNADYNAVVSQIEGTQRKQDIANRIAAIKNDGEREVEQPGALVPRNSGQRRQDADQPSFSFNDGLRSWMKAKTTGAGALSQRELAAAKACGMNPHLNHLELTGPKAGRIKDLQNAVRMGKMPEAPRNAPLTTTTALTGGNTVPAENFLERMEINALHYGPMRQVSEIITTESGEPFTWPTFDDTGNEAVIIGESQPVDNPAGAAPNRAEGGPTGLFGQFTLSAFKFSSQAILIPHELIQDNHVDLEGHVATAIGERIGRGTNRSFTTGGGGGTDATGIVTAVQALPGNVTGNPGAVTWQELIDLVHSVDIAYRTERCCFMAHDLMCANFRKLSDGENRPIWSSGINAGEPDRLCGYMFKANNHMNATMGGGTLSTLFGDAYRYKIRRAGTVRFYHLKELYRGNDQDGFIAMVREDGGLLNAGTQPVAGLVH